MQTNLAGAVLTVSDPAGSLKPHSFAELLSDVCRSSGAPSTLVAADPCPLARLLYVRRARSVSLAISLAERTDEERA